MENTPNVISSIFDVIAQVITEGATVIGTALTSVVSFFWSADGGFTFVGYLLLIAVGMALLWGAYALIKALVRQRVN